MPGYEFSMYRWGKSSWTGPDPYTDKLVQDRFELTMTVPDGMWAMKWSGPFWTTGPFWEYGVLGRPKPEVLDLGREFGPQDFRHTLLLSTEPFLTIKVIYGEHPDGGPTGVPHGAYLNRARQIHKGQLGQYVPIELPLVAREAPSNVQPWTSGRDRKRGYIGWIRLTDAASQAKLSVEEFVLDHWLFVEARDRSYYADPFKDVRIEMIYATDRTDIHKQEVDPTLRLAPSRAEFQEILADESVDWSHYWIRRGFARTVLLLQHYGWNSSKQKHLLGEFQVA